MEQVKMFDLPEVDEEKTQEEVKKFLRRYMNFLFMDPLEAQPKITSSFSIVPPSNNNQFHSSTEEISIKRIDMERQRKKFMKWVQTSVNRLPHQERSILVKRYMTDLEIYDYIAYNELGMSERTYYRVKPKALLRLGFIMRVEKYIEKEDSE